MAGLDMKNIGALSLMADEGSGVTPAAFLQPDPRMDRVIDAAISSGAPDQAQRDKNESLAFAGGMGEDGTFGGGLAKGFAAQSAQRNKQTELQAQYLPHIVQAIQAQQIMKAQQAQMQAMLGAFGGQGGMLDQISQKFGIPKEQVVTELMLKGGAGIPKMIGDRSTPNMEPSGGFMIDKNPYTSGVLGNLAQRSNTAAGMGTTTGATAPRLLPQITTSANGMTSGVQPGADGQAEVYSPRGALDVFKANKEAESRMAKRFETENITPQGEPPQVVTKEDLADRARASSRRGTGSGAPLGPGGKDAAVQRIINDPNMKEPQPATWTGGPNALLDIADIKDPQDLSNALTAYLQSPAASGASGVNPGDQAALSKARTDLQEAVDRRDQLGITRAQQTIQRLTGPKASMGLPLQSEAEAAAQKEATQGQQTQNATQLEQLRKAKNAVATLDDAIKILEGKTKPTHSGVGAMVDKLGSSVGYAVPGAPEAAALATVGGWGTSNVPRMEGPQSNFDVDNYKTMAGMVGNESLPLKTRLAAAKAARNALVTSAPREWGSDAWQKMPGKSILDTSGEPAKPTASGGMPTLDEIMAEKKRRAGGK